MNGDTVDFKRLVSRDARLFVQSGQIYLGDYALTHQRFTTIDELGNDNRTIDSLTNGFIQTGLLKKLADDRDVMFIQIVPDSTMGTLDELGFLNLRQDIEGLIDTRLKMDNSGEWFAGDMGAGGNMLFFIDNWDKAIITVLDVLREQNLVDHVLIAKRVMTTKDDWNYEVIYPIEFEGVFNQM